MAADQNRDRIELARILERLTELVDRLQGLLDEERSALESAEPDRLRSIAISKKLCVQCIDELESERRSLCNAAGFDADGAGMQALAAHCGGGMEAAWNDLLERARETRASNRVNGAIGRVRRQHVASALAVLHGSDPDQPLYGPQGRSPAGHERRPLARI